MVKSRILIAEDEPHLREVLHMQLELAGFEVIEACDGEEALELAQHVRPDVILLDVMMPRMDGYEALQRLRASYATRFIPVIMLTAKDTREDVLTGFQGGANDYLTKPYDRRELLLRINNQLSGAASSARPTRSPACPGTSRSTEETERRLGSGEPFALLQVDIDFFKAYNDHYGYPRGDEAIQTLSRILVEAASHHGEGTLRRAHRRRRLRAALHARARRGHRPGDHRRLQRARSRRSTTPRTASAATSRSRTAGTSSRTSRS